MPARKAAPRPKGEGQPTPRVEDGGVIRRSTEEAEPDRRLCPDTPADPPSPGYIGTLPDDVPNEDYTLAGQVRALNS